MNATVRNSNVPRILVPLAHLEDPRKVPILLEAIDQSTIYMERRGVVVPNEPPFVEIGVARLIGVVEHELQKWAVHPLRLWTVIAKALFESELLVCLMNSYVVRPVLCQQVLPVEPGDSE